MCPEISFLWQNFCLTSVILHMNVTNGYVKNTHQFPKFKAQGYMKCNDNVKDFRGYIHTLEIQGDVLQHLANSQLLRWRSLIACRCQVRLQDLDCQQNQQAYIL